MDEQDEQDGTSPGERSGHLAHRVTLYILSIHVTEVLAVYGCGTAAL